MLTWTSSPTCAVPVSWAALPALAARPTDDSLLTSGIGLSQLIAAGHVHPLDVARALHELKSVRVAGPLLKQRMVEKPAWTHRPGRPARRSHREPRRGELRGVRQVPLIGVAVDPRGRGADELA